MRTDIWKLCRPTVPKIQKQRKQQIHLKCHCMYQLIYELLQVTLRDYNNRCFKSQLPAANTVETKPVLLTTVISVVVFYYYYDYQNDYTPRLPVYMTPNVANELLQILTIYYYTKIIKNELIFLLS